MMLLMDNYNKLNHLTLGYVGVKRLARERPDWLPIVKVCLEMAQSVSGDFAGAWVLNKAKEMGIKWREKDWFPNLRVLVSYSILQRTGISRGGRRAYYLMPDIEGVRKALIELEGA